VSNIHPRPIYMYHSM